MSLSLLLLYWTSKVDIKTLVIWFLYSMHFILTILFNSILQAKFHGHAFIRLHAPWQVLSREAEFLKIKVPTKKVRYICPCRVSGDTWPAWDVLVFLSALRHPRMRYSMSLMCVRVKAIKYKWMMPIVGLVWFWLLNLMFCLQSYELREDTGLVATMNEVWRKINQPFQPKVPHQEQEHSRTKFLSHCFSRDKLHLWVFLDWRDVEYVWGSWNRPAYLMVTFEFFRYNIKSKDTFFDNATRSRIVSLFVKVDLFFWHGTV